MAALRVWVITDGRLGHLNQLKGLIARLQSKAEVTVSWLNIAEQGFAYTGRHELKKQFSAEQLPDWIVGAGSRTHLPMLWLKWLTGGRALVLMRPSWPLLLFDAICMPLHDSPPARKNVLATQGVINHIVPVTSGRDSARGLILLGGINKHFAWDNEAILAQLERISAAAPGVVWLVSDSPRTPAGLLAQVEGLGAANIETIAYQQTGPGWLQANLTKVGQAWVTCDSVSMVYESISSGANTGLLALPPLRKSRVTKSMAQVLATGLASDVATADLHNMLPPAAYPLWEADRAADWLLQLASNAQRKV
ncbi:mitochondrial fission ELM1 family protein [Zhongshania borealis]|uniref:Nucleoside-diphosphate sugar epimerase n=1 Tax=Zhongshania borealis TaxID=889488 RepID=A0ABP7WZ02_9GAMM